MALYRRRNKELHEQFVLKRVWSSAYGKMTVGLLILLDAPLPDVPVFRSQYRCLLLSVRILRFRCRKSLNHSRHPILLVPDIHHAFVLHPISCPLREVLKFVQLRDRRSWPDYVVREVVDSKDKRDDQSLSLSDYSLQWLQLTILLHP